MTAAQGSSAVARSSWTETRPTTSSTAEALNGADLGQRRQALAQPVVQRARRPARRPRPHLTAGEGELLREQVTDVAGADEADRTVQRSRVAHAATLTTLREVPTTQYYAAATLDGYIADPDDGLGWLMGYEGSYEGEGASPDR